MDIKVNGRTLSDRPLVLGVQGDNNVEELRFLIPRYTGSGVDLSQGIGYAVFRLPDGTDGYVSLTPEVLDTDENTVSLTLLVGSQMTEQKGSGKLCLKVAGLESAMWSSTICDMFVNGTIAMPSPQPVSLFRTMYVGPKLAEDESEPPLTVTERTINIPTELQTIAVAQDENSEAVKIMVPRYFDGQDLSVHDFILHTEMGSNGTDDILFNNQNGQMKSVEDSTVTLTWVLRPPQTSFEGKLNIQLLVQGDEFKWHSLIGELTIAKHITGDPVVPATPSMYEQWLAEVKEQADYVRSQASNIQAVIDEMDAIKDAPAAAGRAEKATEDAKKAAEDAKKAASESKGFRTFFSSVRPDANGNLDPSRPMTVGPAASVEIESAGDRIESVTAHGFTQQAGTGDPSPTNVRAITNGGRFFNATVYTGQESWTAYSDKANTFIISAGALIHAGVSSHYAGLNFGELGTKNGIYLYSTLNVLVTDLSCSSVDEFKAKLQSLYAAGTPLTAWYNKRVNGAEEKWEPGKTLYAPIILEGGEYRATCLPLTAPLCEGDSVVSLAKSGCDKVVTFDGSEDEQITIEGTMSGGYVRAVVQVSGMLGNLDPGNAFVTSWVPVVSDYNGAYTHAYNASKRFYLFLQADDVQGVRSVLSKRPLTVWYRSTNYTEAADIPVSLETHRNAVLVLDGNSVTDTTDEGLPTQLFKVSVPCSPKMPNTIDIPILSNQYKFVTWDQGPWNVDFSISYDTPTHIRIKDSRFTTVEDINQNLAAQYAAGTPVTIVYKLDTPITYTHPAVELEAATGDQLTYTVTGQSGGTVSVALKPFQDGGHAKTADSAANAQNAVNAQTANNSQQLGGLTLSALQNLLVPVGYIFSWAPTSGGPDLSTASKVAAYFGFGTWAAYGTGQVLVGLDAGQTEFATPGKTGGEKTHTLTVPELASHSHAYAVDTNVTYAGTPGYDMFKVADSGSSNTGETGGNQPHNNLQPYVVVYRWQRVA